jgi:hypothetical protein
MSDAPYHDVGHTVAVTLLGTAILRGRGIAERVTPDDWLHMTVALLCHAVGQVRGACRGDTATEAVISLAGERRAIPRGASDAWLAPFRVDRGEVFVRERAGVIPGVDPDRVARAIGLTRFPLPEDDDPRETGTEAGLVRAAALIDQLANPDGLRKQTALFRELAETGMTERLGLASAADLGDRFVGYFWERVEPLVGDALRYLALTWEGRQYTANLYARCSRSSTAAGGWARTRAWRRVPHRRREPLLGPRLRSRPWRRSVGGGVPVHHEAGAGLLSRWTLDPP